jgi:hypothetical protein
MPLVPMLLEHLPTPELSPPQLLRQVYCFLWGREIDMASRAPRTIFHLGIATN